MRQGPVQDWKVEEVELTKKFIESKPVVGIINLSSLPSSQFQAIKKKLRGKADVKVIQSNFILRAFDKVKNPKLQELKAYVDGPAAIIIADENPFSLYKFMKKNRSKAAAKPGMIADHDLIIPAGETSLPVGPALSELKMAKVDCKVVNQKIFVNKDSIVTKKGEAVTTQAASAMSKLGILPVEIGLSIKAMFEKDVIYTPDTLDIDEEAFMQNLQGSYVKALNLSVNAGYPTKQNMPLIIQKAFTKARNLAVNAKIYNKESMPLILSKSAAEMNGIKSVATSKGYAE